MLTKEVRRLLHAYKCSLATGEGIGKQTVRKLLNIIEVDVGSRKPQLEHVPLAGE